jgi:hypothetical protein
MTRTKDDLQRARLVHDEWTPAHGTEKRIKRQQARARLRAWTRALIARVLGGDDDAGERWR